MNKLLYWLSGFLPYREISDGETPYLERYYVGTLLGWRVYLHQFVGSDPDRGLHDHPWPRAFSIILSGWYCEETRSGTRKVRWFNSITGDTFHRVVLPCSQFTDGSPCWTLFFHRAGKVKPWGFWREIEDSVYPDAAVFHPYHYTREGSQKNWWLTAKSRRELGK